MAVDDSPTEESVFKSSSPFPWESLTEKAPSKLLIHAWCKNGNLEHLEAFLDTTLPGLPREHQSTYCSHLDDQCSHLPCTLSILTYARTAAEGRRANVFAHLWDTYLAARGIHSVPWPCLKAAAFNGDVALAQTFYTRDPLYFQTAEPVDSTRLQGPGPGTGNNQFKIAIRNDRFDYIDAMLAHGADINRDAGSSDLVKMVVHCAVDDAITVRRIRFLAARGVDLARSAALTPMVAAGSLELVECLLDNGADVNGSEKTAPDNSSSPPLVLAAGTGNDEMVELLLAHGADADYVDQRGRSVTDLAVEGGHKGVVRIFEAYREKNNKKSALSSIQRDGGISSSR